MAPKNAASLWTPVDESAANPASAWTPVNEAPPQPAYVPPAGNSISATSPSWMDRLRGTVANSAIGHSLETGLPKVADALNLHPTETVNSPTYQSDKEQVVAPQYLMPGNPQGFAGNVTKGALTGVGQLTNKKSLATTAGIAATGGLAAPLATGTGTLATIGRLGAQGLKYGMAAQGAKGVYNDGKNAVSLYNSGNTAGAEQALGAALPNAAMTLPAMGEPLRRVGEGMQEAGGSLWNQTIGSRKKDFARGNDPGGAALEAGMGPSWSLGSIADKGRAIQEKTGAQIGQLHEAATNSGVRISPQDYQTAYSAPIQSARASLMGEGGTGEDGGLDKFASTFVPSEARANQIRGNGGLTPTEVWNTARNIDKNTVWNDPSKLNLNQVRQQTSGSVRGLLKDTVPDVDGNNLSDLNRRYAGITALTNRAGERSLTHSSPLTDIGAKALSTLGMAAVGSADSPHAALAMGAGGLLANSVPAKTTAAYGLYHAGRGLSAAGSGLSSLFSPAAILGSAENGNASEYEQPGAQGQNNISQGNSPMTSPSLYRSGSSPVDIIHPSQMSRSNMGLGPNGSGGTIVRPLGLLPAPAKPVPEATPYVFGGNSPTAIPATNPANLAQGVGTRAFTLPGSLLKSIYSGGTGAEKAAALRQANLGSLGGTVPTGSFKSVENPMKPPPPIIEGLYGKKKK